MDLFKLVHLGPHYKGPSPEPHEDPYIYQVQIQDFGGGRGEHILRQKFADIAK